MPPVSYPEFIERLKREQGHDRAMEAAIGRHFDPVGEILRAFLIQSGLLPQHYLIDVGCGAGRLAKYLSDYLTGPYLGTDVVSDLVDYARQLAARPDWRFETVGEPVIPERDARADFICFFSVFTHLAHADSFRYLKEAARVARPGGRIVFTFLEFAVARHWAFFETALDPVRAEAQPSIDFLSRDAIDAWVAHLPVTIEAIHAGDVAHVELPRPVSFPDGPKFERMATLGPIGQSVCILRKR
ncbi:MAG: class I SAM-dependent methyltransferase [Casimicrobiaceae bacterium]